MSDDAREASLEGLCSRLQLGPPQGPPERLPGGALHTNWKVTLADETYVIKQLNSQIARKPGIIERYEEAEQIATEFYKAQIPAVAALKIKSHFVHAFQDELYILYPFVEGSVQSVEELRGDHTQLMGQLFAALHSCELPISLLDKTPHYDVFEDDHWRTLIERFNHPRLTGLLPALIEWNNRYRACIPRLNQEILISHRDLHTSNVLWAGSSPHVIDWESAGYTNPLQEIIGFSLEWSGIIYSQLNEKLFSSMSRAYHEQMTALGHTRPLEGLFGWLGNSVMGWTEFNLRRALGDGFEADEQKRGAKIIEHTMTPCLSFIKTNLPKIIKLLKPV